MSLCFQGSDRWRAVTNAQISTLCLALRVPPTQMGLVVTDTNQRDRRGVKIEIQHKMYLFQFLTLSGRMLDVRQH